MLGPALATHAPGLTSALRRGRRAVLRRRRPIAAVAAAVAVAAGLHAATAPPPPLVPVVVARHALPPGAVLADDDLAVVGFAPGSVPADVVRAPVGSRLAAGVGAGEPITAQRLLGERLAVPPGTVATPVRLTDAGLAALLRVGDAIDLLATDPTSGTTRTVAGGVRVLSLPDGSPGSADDGATAAGLAGGTPGAAVVLAVPAPEVEAVADASARLLLGYVWVT